MSSPLSLQERGLRAVQREISILRDDFTRSETWKGISVVTRDWGSNPQSSILSMGCVLNWNLNMIEIYYKKMDEN